MNQPQPGLWAPVGVIWEGLVRSAPLRDLNRGVQEGYTEAASLQLGLVGFMHVTVELLNSYYSEAVLSDLGGDQNRPSS